jgi:hypothetical protein
MMLRRLARDESGVALGLAVIMIMLIGVMGAGLLVFVRNDLEAVVEVNQGQRAIDAADAGVQAARRRLLFDATERLYDGVNDPAASPPNLESPWAYNGTGKNLSFNGGTNNVNVKIQYLRPSTNSSQLASPDFAPEIAPETAPGSGVFDYPEPKDYFKVTSTGIAGNAKRKIEAIYLTEDIGVPKGYYTPGNVTISDTACLDSVSVFALGDVTFDGGGGCDTGGHIKGTDLAYADWYRSPFNTTARPTNLAGVGATGAISGSTQMGTRDFDGPDAEADGYEFIQKNPSEGSQGSSEISFPFDYALPDTDFLRDIAKANGSYFEVAGGTASVSNWPAPPPGSDASKTVVFYRFTSSSSNTLKWDVYGSCSDPPKQGILAVEGGNFTTQPNKALLRGAVVVRGGTVADGSFDDPGGTCLEGFVNADGEIRIAGNVSPISSVDAAKQPGFYGVRLWSWRELYQ